MFKRWECYVVLFWNSMLKSFPGLEMALRCGSWAPASHNRDRKYVLASKTCFPFRYNRSELAHRRTAHKREWGTFLQERWDPWSELPYNQNPKSGPNNWIKPWPAVTKGSADPLKSPSESRIRLRYLSNPPIPTPIHPLQMTCFSSLVDHAFTAENWWLKCISCFIVKYLSPSLSSAKVVRFFKLVELLYVILCQ